MKYLKAFLLVLVICCSCKKVITNDINIQADKIIKEERVTYQLHKYELDKLKIHSLKIIKTDTTLIYNYVNSIDGKYNIDFEFSEKEKELLFYNGERFHIIDSSFVFVDKRISEDPFYFFWQENGKSHQSRPILFNEKYGLLGVFNSYGPELIILKHKTEDFDLITKIKNAMGDFAPK
ncbi:hypothetical protein LPB136_02570 [Tenacibaculum todarodis]|uniref:Uncharacterized protein n=1 Tax=Tenacibaculum todarodis TaxID=1850252 RepID=A0A1L3JGR1_9FLAO|nr:hypothetical protein [Tenacibaculum todarodis]APG64321.1 hypothetical protein LPB136_02570 [Tenacibaculum todarodis]